ncbi:Cytoplasmic aconitate hydratase [Manis javanica]|nr:Cytoplasmic aconitate hydratase [Manis javanica]
MNHTHKKLPGTTLHYIDAPAAVDALSASAWARMPYTARVPPRTLGRRARSAQLDSYLLQLIERRRDIDFPWYPVRGLPRHPGPDRPGGPGRPGDAIAAEGGDPAQVNPVVPVQLIVDHSLAVECGGFDPDAFVKNRAIEDRRNEGPLPLHRVDKSLFQRGCDPAGQDHAPDQSGKNVPVVTVQDGLAPPILRGTDSHAPCRCRA